MAIVDLIFKDFPSSAWTMSTFSTLLLPALQASWKAAMDFWPCPRGMLVRSGLGREESDLPWDLVWSAFPSAFRPLRKGMYRPRDSVLPLPVDIKPRGQCLPLRHALFATAGVDPFQRARNDNNDQVTGLSYPRHRPLFPRFQGWLSLAEVERGEDLCRAAATVT
jgi:hypothetical protein